jgi:hypothetical protein
MLGCGGGGGGGGGPTAPPPLPSANIVCAPNNCILTFPNQLCLGDCFYRVEYRNIGAGCARLVRGVVRLERANNSVLESDEWELNPTGVVRPNEAFAVEDCCLSRGSMNAADHFSTEVFWTNTACPTAPTSLAAEPEESVQHGERGTGQVIGPD